jgi:hypothetical protein
LEQRIAVRTLPTEIVQRAIAPDDTTGEQHRAAGPVALLDQRRRDAELPGSRRRRQPGHAGAGDVHLGQREARFVLDVLDPHPLGTPEEDRVRVRRVDDVVDLDPELFGLGDVLFGRVDKYREVVE